MTEVEFQAGDELDGDLENEGFAGEAGAADENADATAVSSALPGVAPVSITGGLDVESEF